MVSYLEIARRVMREPLAPDPDQVVSLEAALKGRAIELWSTAAGGLFLVANEEDALLAIERFGTRRGEIYTAAEARLIISVNDRASVAEIHAWKHRFDGVVSDFRGDHPK